MVSYIFGAMFSLCDCALWILIIGGGLWFFVFRKKGDVEDLTAAANAENRALDNKASAAFDQEEEDDVATIVAPQPVPAAEKPARPARPPRSAGATIIAFDDDDLLDD